jgi:hypothetical protein
MSRPPWPGPPPPHGAAAAAAAGAHGPPPVRPGAGAGGVPTLLQLAAEAVAAELVDGRPSSGPGPPSPTATASCMAPWRSGPAVQPPPGCVRAFGQPSSGWGVPGSAAPPPHAPPPPGPGPPPGSGAEGMAARLHALAAAVGAPELGQAIHRRWWWWWWGVAGSWWGSCARLWGSPTMAWLPGRGCRVPGLGAGRWWGRPCGGRLLGRGCAGWGWWESCGWGERGREGSRRWLPVGVAGGLVHAALGVFKNDWATWPKPDRPSTTGQATHRAGLAGCWALVGAAVPQAAAGALVWGVGPGGRTDGGRG